MADGEYMGGGDLARIDYEVRRTIAARQRLDRQTPKTEGPDPVFEGGHKGPPLRGKGGESIEDGFRIKSGMTETGLCGSGGKVDGMGRKTIVCATCGVEAENAGRGLCVICYMRVRREERAAAAGRKYYPRVNARKDKSRADGFRIESGTTRATQIPAPGLIVVDFSRPEDMPVLAKLRDWASRQRRTIEQQAAWMLERELADMDLEAPLATAPDYAESDGGAVGADRDGTVGQ